MLNDFDDYFATIENKANNLNILSLKTLFQLS